MFARARETWVSAPVDAARLPCVSGPSRALALLTDVPAWGRFDLRPPDATLDLSPFPQVIAGLVARFVAVTPDAIDDTIVDGLREVAEVLHLDHAVLWRKGADDVSAAASHYWIKHSQPPLPEPLQLASIPFFAARLEGGEAGWVSGVMKRPTRSIATNCCATGCSPRRLFPCR